MTFLPIVERELRVAARKKGTHWLWFFAGLTAMIVAFIVLLGSQRSASPQSLGAWVFNTISGIAFTFSLLAGVFLTSDCLCSEKRAGTLWLLFLTDLKGYDVVLGKLVATSIVSVYALLAIIPMLGLPLMMGGVSLAEFGRMTLALLATLFLSLATGMFASAISRETRAAMMGSFGVMLGLTGGVFGVALVLTVGFDWKAAEFFALISPIGAFMLSFELQYNMGWYAMGYWVSLGSLAALGFSQLVGASLLLPREWQASGVEVDRPTGTRLSRRGVGNGNPFQWLLERDAFPGPFTRVIAGSLFFAWFCLLVGTFFVGQSRQDGMMTASFAVAVALHVIAKGLLAMQATRRFSEDRRSGALELLLTTPIEAGTILDAQRVVLKRQFRWFQTALLAVNLGLILCLIFAMHRRWNEWEPVVTISIFCAGGMVLWLVDAHALTWVGMWTGLRGLRHHRAVLNTVGRLLAPAWLGFLLYIFLIAGSSSIEGVFGLWLVWFSFSAVSALLAARNRKSELIDDFRRLASGDKPRKGPDAPGPWSPEWESPKAASTPPAA